MSPTLFRDHSLRIIERPSIWKYQMKFALSFIRGVVCPWSVCPLKKKIMMPVVTGNQWFVQYLPIIMITTFAPSACHSFLYYVGMCDLIAVYEDNDTVELGLTSGNRQLRGPEGSVSGRWSAWSADCGSPVPVVVFHSLSSNATVT